MRLILDSESDDFPFDAKKIWCIGVKDVDSHRVFLYLDHPLPDLVLPDHIKVFYNLGQYLDKLCDHTLIAHNLWVHDYQLFCKFSENFSRKFKFKQGIDTLVLSQLLWADRPNGHSLDSWAETLGHTNKLQYKDFKAGLTKEMVIYMLDDMKVNEAVYHKLREEATGHNWKDAVRTEQLVAYFHGFQTQRGILVDYEKAESLWVIIDDLIRQIEEYLTEVLPYQIKRGTEVLPFLKSGGYKQVVTKRFEDPSIVSGPYCQIDFERFNLNSWIQVKEYLLSKGWIPTEYTEKGSPKITEDSLESVEGFEGAELIIIRGVLRSRRQFLFGITTKGKYNGILWHQRSDNTVPAEGLTCSANTGRMTHKTIVNVPGGNARGFGKEIRELFIPRPGLEMIGSDAVSLEAAIMANLCYYYPGGKEYSERLMKSSPHKRNMELWGCDKPMAKRGYYALIFGAQPEKVSKIFKVSELEGERRFNAFWDDNNPLKMLRDELHTEWEKNNGWISGLDGRKLFARSPHSVLNLKIQNAGQVIVRNAGVYLMTQVRKRMLPVHQLAFMHDEYEYEYPPKLRDELITLNHEAYEYSSKKFKLPIRIDCDPKYGYSWYDVH